MVYLVLAGGFWGWCKNVFNGRQVDPDAESFNKFVDYVIGIDGLPKEFLEPSETELITKYYCKAHDRIVPEYEINNRIACYNCGKDLQVDQERRPKWSEGIFEMYDNDELDWITPAYRIWCNNQQGREKLQMIMNYINLNYPATKLIPLPVALGNRIQVTVKKSNVPIIILNTAEKTPDTSDKIVSEEKEEEVEKSEFVCDICDKKFDKEKALRMHRLRAHN